MKRLGFGLFGAVLLASCSVSDHTSDVRVTHGKTEQGFPYVVQIVMDSGGTCTGSFVSDNLLLTASHCVDRTQFVKWNNISSEANGIFIHSQWPSRSTGCHNVTQPKYDVALVRFPKGTYKGEVGHMLLRSPKAGEELTIVGYGNNLITPFDKFCKLNTTPNSAGQCEIMLGTRKSGATYSYESIFAFDVKEELSASGCPVKCSSNNMKENLLAAQTTYKDFVAEKCDGNFRDRSYKETGVGTKRSGSNKILTVDDGTIRFQGGAGGTDKGINSASGAGDSGGPLFLMKNGKPRIAGVTHGGSLGIDGDEFTKKSIYVDLYAPHNIDWLRATVKKHQLNFPDLIP